jgi:histidinol-phosphate aminotransferase
MVQKVYPSDANFVLAKMEQATRIYDYLKEKGIIVRNRSNVVLCEDCLRITVGTPEQDKQLLKTLKEYKTI